jgi:hypothetical protein
MTDAVKRFLSLIKVYEYLKIFYLCFYRVLFRFLSAEDEALRIYSLKLIGAFLRYCPIQ